MITNYQIEMLNVADADAFIVYYLTNDEKEHLVLIDAGRYGNGSTVLKHLNKHHKGIPVELAIVTHPDEDHYGGFVYMVEHIKNKEKDAVPIKQFWLNDPRKYVTVDDIKEDILKTTLEKRLKEIYSDNDTDLITLLDDSEIPYKEAFAETEYEFEISDDCEIESIIKKCAQSEQEGFTILGPTKEYYQKQCEDFKYNGVTVVKEIAEEEDKEDEPSFEPSEECYSKALDDAYDDTSCSNKSSIIVLFQPTGNGKYLFAGDASVESFDDMDEPHKVECEDIRWLKVPHHGSEHNMNSALIKHLNPKIAYISTLKRGRYLSQCTINALKKKGCRVMSTHNNQDLSSIFHNRFHSVGDFVSAQWS